MIAGLQESIESLEIPPQSAAVVEVAQQYSALGAKLTMALAELDRRREYELDGYASMTAWCRTELGWTNQTANRILRHGRRLLDLPVTAGAWLSGRLSDGQIEIVVACVTDRRAPLWRDHEAEVVPLLVPLDLLSTNRAVQDWAAKADAVLDEQEPAEDAAAEAMLVKTLDGRGYLKGTFDAEHTEVVATGLRLADSGDLDEPVAKRQGQALVDVFRFFLDHQTTKVGGRHRPHLNVVVDKDALHDSQAGRTLVGVPLPGLVVRKIACDASIHRVIADGVGSILDYGRSTRTIPPAVYTPLVLRDWGCRFPGCDRPADWCEGHHVWHWEDGGPTNLSNLVLLCAKHHHVVHLKGWHLRIDPSGTVEVTEPTGRVRTSDPPGQARAA
jgi:Domain of unknown function (DUF222)/HNH endonuclease